MSGTSLRQRPDPAGGAAAPASLREALAGVPETERDLYLYLREAVLALSGTGERFRPDGRRWLPTLSTGHREIARVLFSRTGRGSHRGMSVELALPPAMLAELSETVELQAATRAALRSAIGPEAAPPCLQVSDESELAEVVAVLLIADARLRAGA